METKNLELNQYELDALKISLEKYINVLEEQINSLKKIKHSSSETKKQVQRNLGKQINLLKDVLNKV